jgi:NADH-quinone oxidoreductase subunit A
VKLRDVIRIIEANGFVLSRHHGTSHRQYRGNIGGQVRYVAIACHSEGDDVKPRTLRCCDAGPGCAGAAPGVTAWAADGRFCRGGSLCMNQLLLDYLPLVVFMGVALVIGLALMVAPFLVAVRNPDPEKVSAYECGFNAFDDARMKFDALLPVSILFIIFRPGGGVLFPWAVAFKEVGAFGFWAMMVFLAVLTIGFAYEWRKGALEWD